MTRDIAWGDDIPTLGIISNYTALKSFMIFHLNESLKGVACLKGSMVEFKSYSVPRTGEVIPVNGYGVNFIVGTINWLTDTFVLTLGKPDVDKAFGVELPDFMREELIASFKVKW